MQNNYRKKKIIKMYNSYEVMNFGKFNFTFVSFVSWGLSDRKMDLKFNFCLSLSLFTRTNATFLISVIFRLWVLAQNVVI